MNVLEMNSTHENDKEVFDFFKQLKIEDIQTLIVEPYVCSSSYYTYFYFKTKNGETISCYYKSNEEIDKITVSEEKDYLFLKNRNLHKEWINHIWEQLMDHFNLRIRLMFISETIPWKWNTVYTY